MLAVTMPSRVVAARVMCALASAARMRLMYPPQRSRQGGAGAPESKYQRRAAWRRGYQPSLGLFIAAGALIGAGGGTIFRGAVGTVMSIAPPDRMAESLAGLFLVAFVGISLPAVGAGITLSLRVSPKDTILGFAVAVSAGIAASAIRLMGRTTIRAGGAPAAAGPDADSPDGKPGHHLVENPNERRAV